MPPHPTTSPRTKTTTHPPWDKPPDWQLEVSCRKLCCHVWKYSSHNTSHLQTGDPELYQNPKLTGTTYTITPKQMAQCKLSMKWLCKMANSVLGVNWGLVEYCHLIANQTTRATWQHSYGNKIRCLVRECQGATPAPTPLSSSRKTRYCRTENRMWPTAQSPASSDLN